MHVARRKCAQIVCDCNRPRRGGSIAVPPSHVERVLNECGCDGGREHKLPPVPLLWPTEPPISEPMWILPG